MKKTLLAIAAMVAMVACNNDYVVKEAAPEAISFENMFVDNATRIDDKSLTKNNLENFAVYGSVTNNSNTALIFDNVEVNKTITNNDLSHLDGWRYAGTQYWIEGAAYDFAAVAPYGCSQADDFNTNTKKTTIEFTNDGVTDLLYAQTTDTGLASGNTAVGFTFRHTLSKVKFSFENQYLSTGTTIAVRNIVLTNPHKTATVVLDATNTVWDAHATANDFTIAFGDTENTTGVAATSIAQDTEWESANARFIIPGKAGEAYTYTVAFKVDILYGTTVIKTYDHTASLTFNPAAATAYDIKTVINHENIDPNNSQEPIEFTVTAVEDWANYTDQTATID